MKDERILLEFRHAYNKCQSCLRAAENDLKKYAFNQRMDEILLIYSSLFNISVNDTRDALCTLIESEDEDGN